MRKALTALVLSFAVTSAAWSQDNRLFSGVRVDSVFSTSTAAARDAVPRSPGDSAQPPESRLSDAGQMSRLLREAGFEPEEVASRVVTAKTQRGDWTFPVVFTVSEDAGQAGLVLLLSAADENQTFSHARLLDLLDANRNYHPACFAYSPKHRRLELYRVMENRQLTAERVRAEIDRLARIALETESLWRLEDAASDPTAAAGDAPPEDAQPLAGTWSAVRSDQEAFAIQFRQDGTFHLVYVNQGRQTKSTGRFVRDGQQLTLEAADGLRLSGTIRAQTADAFRFQPEHAASSSASLLFQRSGDSR